MNLEGEIWIKVNCSRKNNPSCYNMEGDIENINQNLSDQFQIFKNLRDQSPTYTKSPWTPISPFNEISDDDYKKYGYF